MSYEVTLQKFSGPLEVLLSLIEARELEITEISLAEATGDFLAHLEKLKTEEAGDGEETMQLIVGFIVVASRLLLIKSKALLPNIELTAEEEADIRDLERRLAMYKEFRAAMRSLNRRWQNAERAFSRPYLFARHRGDLRRFGVKTFYPGTTITPNTLADALGGVIDIIRRTAYEEESVKERFISLEEKIAEVIRRLKTASTIAFGRLREKQGRGEVVMLFLALLHLAHDRLVTLEQTRHFSDILVRKNSR